MFSKESQSPVNPVCGGGMGLATRGGENLMNPSFIAFMKLKIKRLSSLGNLKRVGGDSDTTLLGKENFFLIRFQWGSDCIID